MAITNEVTSTSILAVFTIFINEISPLSSLVVASIFPAVELEPSLEPSLINKRYKNGQIY